MKTIKTYKDLKVGDTLYGFKYIEQGTHTTQIPCTASIVSIYHPHLDDYNNKSYKVKVDETDTEVFLYEQFSQDKLSDIWHDFYLDYKKFVTKLTEFIQKHESNIKLEETAKDILTAYKSKLDEKDTSNL